MVTSELPGRPASGHDHQDGKSSESIEATLHRRRVLFAGFVAHMDDARLPQVVRECVMLGDLLRGAGCVGGQEKEWMGCFLDDDLRTFGINADQWTTAAQDEGEWRRTAEQGGERSMAKLIGVEKVGAGPRHHAAATTVVCPKVTGRTNERIAQSKRARAGPLTIVDQPQVART